MNLYSDIKSDKSDMVLTRQKVQKENNCNKGWEKLVGAVGVKKGDGTGGETKEDD